MELGPRPNGRPWTPEEKISSENLSLAQRVSKQSRGCLIERRLQYAIAQVGLGYRCERSSLEANLHWRTKGSEARPASQKVHRYVVRFV